MVEDDFELRYALADALRSFGWEVRGAADGADALGTLREWRPDVILLDLLLPSMDGWTFTHEAQRQSMLDGIPIIITSGLADTRREAEKLQAAAVLPKPIDVDELVGVIEGLVGRSEAVY
jgi:two-component system OmpR family response regulator